jgi:hypothetical protein
MGNLAVRKSRMTRVEPLQDEIDRVLAQHYGFTEAELDFIIHYDIKYRLGRDAEDAGDEGENGRDTLSIIDHQAWENLPTTK